MQSPPRILVVEDEALLRFVMCEVLRDGNLEVVEATNAKGALDYLRREDHIDLVFTDVNMPGSMDGVGLAHAVTHSFPDVKVIVTSGRPRPDNLGHTLFIPKPYVAYDVMDLIKAEL